MALLLGFAALLLVAVLISRRAGRSILSTTVVFLAGGALLGPGVLGWVDVGPEDVLIERLAELALVSVLFTEGLGLDPDTVRRLWRLPARAIGLGLPLTVAVTAVAAHWLVGLSWSEALLVGAVLGPTDPVFASALIRHRAVPGSVRHLLAVESGLNDALALPLVMVFLHLARHDPGGSSWLSLLGELGAGVLLGAAVPVLYACLERSAIFGARARYRPIGVVAVALLLYASSRTVHASPYLALFVGGFVLARLQREDADAFEPAGKAVSELAKLAAVFAFGLLVVPAAVTLPAVAWIFAAVCLLLARPIALGLALIGSSLGAAERATAAWFGPRGFASVVFGMLVLHGGLARSAALFELIALVIALSIVLHSSTDQLVASLFERRGGGGPGRPGSA